MMRPLQTKPYMLNNEEGQFLQSLGALVAMTAYDVATDPIASTANSRWVWHNGGDYFGVPLTNFAGWLLVVYCFLQIFTLLISRPERDGDKYARLFCRRTYWMEAAIVYFFMGILPVIQHCTHTDHVELFGSMALVSIFTVIFIALLSFFTLQRQEGAE